MAKPGQCSTLAETLWHETADHRIERLSRSTHQLDRQTPPSLSESLRAIEHTGNATSCHLAQAAVA